MDEVEPRAHCREVPLVRWYRFSFFGSTGAETQAGRAACGGRFCGRLRKGLLPSRRLPRGPHKGRLAGLVPAFHAAPCPTIPGEPVQGEDKSGSGHESQHSSLHLPFPPLSSLRRSFVGSLRVMKRNQTRWGQHLTHSEVCALPPKKSKNGLGNAIKKCENVLDRNGDPKGKCVRSERSWVVAPPRCCGLGPQRGTRGTKPPKSALVPNEEPSCGTTARARFPSLSRSLWRWVCC